MSVLMNFAIFPTDKGTSVSEYVSQIIDMIRSSGFNYKLSPMATVIETATMKQALEIVQKANDILEPYSDRIYSTITFDIQNGKNNRIESKVKSIENRIGTVDK